MAMCMIAIARLARAFRVRILAIERSQRVLHVMKPLRRRERVGRAMLCQSTTGNQTKRESCDSQGNASNHGVLPVCFESQRFVPLSLHYGVVCIARAVCDNCGSGAAVGAWVATVVIMT